MNKEQVIEGNKLIAEFMGHKISYGLQKEMLISTEEITYTPSKYHSSWDWLMPVVEKIHDECKLYSEGLKFFEGLTVFSTIQQVRDAVLQFIQWYNSPNTHP